MRKHVLIFIEMMLITTIVYASIAIFMLQAAGAIQLRDNHTNKNYTDVPRSCYITHYDRTDSVPFTFTTNPPTANVAVAMEVDHGDLIDNTGLGTCFTPNTAALDTMEWIYTCQKTASFKLGAFVSMDINSNSPSGVSWAHGKTDNLTAINLLAEPIRTPVGVASDLTTKGASQVVVLEKDDRISLMFTPGANNVVTKTVNYNINLEQISDCHGRTAWMDGYINMHVWGDSLAHGTVSAITSQESYLTLFEEGLYGAEPGKNGHYLKVKELSCGAATSKWFHSSGGAGRHCVDHAQLGFNVNPWLDLGWRNLVEDKPDILLMWFGTYDAVAGIPPATYRTYLVQIIFTIVTNFPGVHIVLATPPPRPDGVPAYDFLMQQYATESQIACNIFSASDFVHCGLRFDDMDPSDFDGTDIHPNAPGQEYMYYSIIQFLESEGLLDL